MDKNDVGHIINEIDTCIELNEIENVHQCLIDFIEPNFNKNVTIKDVLQILDYFSDYKDVIFDVLLHIRSKNGKIIVNLIFMLPRINKKVLFTYKDEKLIPFKSMLSI